VLSFARSFHPPKTTQPKTTVIRNYRRGLVPLKEPRLVRSKGTNALLLGVVVVSGRRNVSSLNMKISASMWPSSKSNWLS
jgi:hypothetical protein